MAHFRKVDRVIYRVMIKTDLRLPEIEAPANYFTKLCREIVGQQLASKAANAIFTRFVNLFPNQKITPEKIIKVPDQKLRDTGLSWAKVKYVKDLAQKVRNREVVIDNLNNLDDEAVALELIKVKGIGPWTAEMFLIFTLGRENVFSPGDLALKKALIRLYDLKVDPSQKEISQIVDKWTPYKTYGSLTLWSIFD